jgi:hypothetical protein
MRADLTLQKDAITYAHVGAASVVKDCKKFDVTNTKFERFGLASPPTPDPEQHFRRWWETWTLNGCGRSVDVPLDFDPSEKGTRIVQPGGSVVRWPPRRHPLCS